MSSVVTDTASWRAAARRRRTGFAVLILVPTALAARSMVEILPRHGSTALELGLIVVFATLFAWISIGFWTSVLGFITLVHGGDPFALVSTTPETPAPPATTRTAVVMPVCNEDVDRVFAGVRATYESVTRTGQLNHFDFFILSDTSDPDKWIEEEVAWGELCRSLHAFDRIYYRRRHVRIHRKTGNIADFCRRWGKNYRYMVILDADSVMTGDALIRMVHTMECHPRVGILQSVPVTVNRESLFGRIEQFAQRVYGPIYAAGIHYRHLGEAPYWGHNAIIRLASFIRHCALPRLPGTPPLGGEILSHDFVEAAFMGRAGWEAWLAYDLPGSYEEAPPTLIDALKRDRRWCQGNLQHLKLFLVEGIRPAHRSVFATGVMTYVSALLWCVFLILSGVEAVAELPVRLASPPGGAMALLAATATLLFLPKMLAASLILIKPEAAAPFGGPLRLGVSVVLETFVSALLAPIRMLFHTRFVCQILLGRIVQWGSQARDDAETGWRTALAAHGSGTALAVVGAVGAFSLDPGYFGWLLPVLAGLILAIPLSVGTSRRRLGRAARAWGLFLIPEETAPPPELMALDARLKQAKAVQFERHPAQTPDGFIRAVADPAVNALHLWLSRKRPGRSPKAVQRRSDLVEKAVRDGPAGLTPGEKLELLSDPECLATLHTRVWELPEAGFAAWWDESTPMHQASTVDGEAVTTLRNETPLLSGGSPGGGAFQGADRLRGRKIENGESSSDGLFHERSGPSG